MQFIAIDVETANEDMASVCQIGIAQFAGGVVSQEWKTYINPEDYRIVSALKFARALP